MGVCGGENADFVQEKWQLLTGAQFEVKNPSAVWRSRNQIRVSSSPASFVWLTEFMLKRISCASQQGSVTANAA